MFLAEPLQFRESPADHVLFGRSSDRGRGVVAVENDAVQAYYRDRLGRGLEQGAVSSFPIVQCGGCARFFGDVSCNEQPTYQSPPRVAQGGDAQIVVALLVVYLDIDLYLCLHHVPVPFDKIGPGGQHPLNRLVDGLGRRHSNDPLCRRIEIDDPVLGVQYHYAIGNGFNDGVARHRHDVQQAEAEQTPANCQAGHGEGEGRQIQVGVWAQAKYVYRVPYPGRQHADQQRRDLPAVEDGRAPEGLEEQEAAQQEQHVGVGCVGKEAQAVGRTEHRVRTTGVQPNTAADQAVTFVRPRQDQDEEGLHRQQSEVAAGQPFLPAGVVEGEGQPGRGHGEDAQKVDVGPKELGRQGRAYQLQDVAQRPFGDGEHNQRENTRAGRRTASPGGDDHRSRYDHGQEQWKCQRCVLPGHTISMLWSIKRWLVLGGSIIVIGEKSMGGSFVFYGKWGYTIMKGGIVWLKAWNAWQRSQRRCLCANWFNSSNKPHLSQHSQEARDETASPSPD